MASEAHAERLSCDLCGAHVSGDEWVGLEVTRATRALDGRDELSFVGGDFCSQDHAAQWLAQPLPEPDPLPEHVQSWRDRWGDVGLGAAVVAVIGLASVGILAIARWVWGLV